MLISIITINYNNKVGLQKTFDSVFNQTFTDFEYIVIDGNSTDGSKELIEQNSSKIDSWISEKDTGVYNAMNKGIRLAKGEYLLFLNSGDFLLEKNTLQNVQKNIDGNYDIYYGNLLIYSKKTNKKEDWVFPNQLTFGFFIDNSLPHQGSFINRTLFQTISLYDETLKIASDWAFFVEAICIKKVTYKHIGIAISEYDLNGMSSDPQNYMLVQSEKKQTYDRHFSMFMDDYKIICELESKRVRSLLYIKKFKISWKLLKGFSNILLIFLPKQRKYSFR